MIHRGSIVRVGGKSFRKGREARVETAVTLSEPFLENGVMVCPIGFFTRRDGPWTRMALLEELQKVSGPIPAEKEVVIPRSYRPEYRIWMSMRRRCSDPRNQGFYLYGGRVSVCSEWGSSFDRFFEDMGPRPSPKHSLDRIDNEGNYEPGNVRWATPKQQARNTSRTRFLTALGQTKPLTQWAEELGLTPQSLEYRLSQGWDIEDVVSRPPQKNIPYRDSLQSKRKRGADHHRAKLDDVSVLAVRAAHEAGESQISLARRFSVAPGTIAYIVHGKTWKHLLPKE